VLFACTPPRAPTPKSCTPIAATCSEAIGDRDALAIVVRNCSQCHGDNGVANHDLTSVAQLRTAKIADMIGTCQMPPDGAAPLRDSEREPLVRWATCPLQNSQ
jgi:hypothetical protein